jgi:hypothetical protein
MKTMNVLVGVLAALAIGGFAVVGWASPGLLEPTQYYLFPVGQIGINVQSLSETAKAEGFAVITFNGNTAIATVGNDSAVDPVDVLLTRDQYFVIDGDHFYLHSAAGQFSYSIRPAGDGHELVLSPTVELSEVDALTTLISDLQALGIQGMDIDLASVQSFPADSLKGPAVPSGLALDSDLYDLTVAEDWFAYAASKGMDLLGLEIEVVVEKVAGGVLPSPFSNLVASETDQLASLIVPIDEIQALAGLASVSYVRLPYRPVAP